MGLREQDIERLNEGVFKTGSVMINNPKEPDEYRCTFCGVWQRGKVADYLTMAQLNRSSTCIWLIAKDLLYNEDQYKIDLI